VWTPVGIVKAWATRRKPEGERWDKDTVLSITQTSLQPYPESDEFRVKTRITPGLAAEGANVPPVVEQSLRAGLLGHAYLTRADFETNGHTDGCRGCRGILEYCGRSSNDSEHCRRRMENLLRGTRQGRERLRAVDFCRGHLLPSGVPMPWDALGSCRQRR